MAQRHAGGEATPGNVRYPAGQRLYCHACGAEVAIQSPCPCDPPDLVLQCCGQDMRAESGPIEQLGADTATGPDGPGTPRQAGVRMDDQRSLFVSGQRVQCPDCGAEVEVTNPTPARYPRQSFRCCGKDMVLTTPAEG